MRQQALSPSHTESQVIESWKFALTCDSFWPWLACTCDDLRWLAFTWSSSNLHSSERNFVTVWPPNASQRKLASALFSFVRAHLQGFTEMAFLPPVWNLRLLAIPFGHPSQVFVRNFTFPNLRWLATPFGQGFTCTFYGACSRNVRENEAQCNFWQDKMFLRNISAFNMTFSCLRLTVFQIKGTFNVHTYRIDTTVLLKQYIFTRY